MLRCALITTTVLLVTATGASAQQWDAPLFFSPRPMDDVGLYYINSDRTEGFGNSNGLKLIWRQSGNLNLGVHAGTGDISSIGESILLGAELYGPLTSLASTTGLAMNWSAGIGAAFGDVDGVDYIDFSIPVGVSLGIRFGAGGAGVTPFVHPRVSFDVIAITPEGGEEFTESEFHFAVDVGAEISLGQRLLVRGAASLGDRDAFGVGVALRTPRKISVVR
jgi:hypothetical protein